MKIKISPLLLIFFLGTFTLCSQKVREGSCYFTVSRFDSVRGYYVIYLRRSSSLFKVISGKANYNSRFPHLLKPGEKYSICIEPLPFRGNIDLQNIRGVSVQFPDSTIVESDSNTDGKLYKLLDVDFKGD